MEIKLLKKCVDSFCHADFVPVWSMFKSHDDWSNRLHALWKEINFERWTIKLLVTLEMQKKNCCTNRKTQPVLLTYGTTER